MGAAMVNAVCWVCWLLLSFLVAFVVCWLLLSFIGCLCRLLAAFVAALVVTEHKTPSRAYVYVCV